jgi:hypothetical protein
MNAIVPINAKNVIEVDGLALLVISVEFSALGANATGILANGVAIGAKGALMTIGAFEPTGGMVVVGGSIGGSTIGVLTGAGTGE